MIRIIVKTIAAIPIGDYPVEVTYETYDIPATPELREAMENGKAITYGGRTIMGAEWKPKRAI